MCDSFGASHFKQSYQKIFARDENDQLEMAFNAEVEVKVGFNFIIVSFWKDLEKLEKHTKN